MLGLFLIVSTGNDNNGGTYNHLLGMVYVISGAILYAAVILTNKRIKNLPSFETALLQLMVAAITLLPVVLLQFNPHVKHGMKSWINIFLLGIVHTGLAYLLYFGSVKELSAQSIAILSYIDPISAVTMAIIFLKEDLTLVKIIGGILILGSTYFAENMDARMAVEEKN